MNIGIMAFIEEIESSEYYYDPMDPPYGEYVPRHDIPTERYHHEPVHLLSL